jgi:uncharacterized membrane protein
MTAAQKEIATFIGLGLMLVAALIVTFARAKTKGFIRTVLTIIAFLMLISGFLYGFIAIM